MPFSLAQMQQIRPQSDLAVGYLRKLGQENYEIHPNTANSEETCNDLSFEGMQHVWFRLSSVEKEHNAIDLVVCSPPVR